jgi:hypothetical protein
MKPPVPSHYSHVDVCYDLVNELADLVPLEDDEEPAEGAADAAAGQAQGAEDQQQQQEEAAADEMPARAAAADPDAAAAAPPSARQGKAARLSNHEMQDAAEDAAPPAPAPASVTAEQQSPQQKQQEEEKEEEAATGSEAEELAASAVDGVVGGDEDADESGDEEEEEEVDAYPAHAGAAAEDDAGMGADEYRDDDNGGGGHYDDDDDEDVDGEDDGAQHLGLKPGHRPFQRQDSPDPAGNDEEEDEDAEAEEDPDDVHFATRLPRRQQVDPDEFGEGVLEEDEEEDEDEQFAVDDEEEEEDEDGADGGLHYKPAAAARSSFFRAKPAPAIAAATADDDGDAIDLTLSDDDEPPPRSAAAAAAKPPLAAATPSVAAPVAASAASTSSSSAGSSPRATPVAVPQAASGSAHATDASGVPMSIIPTVTPTSPGSSPIPTAQFSPLAPPSDATGVSPVPDAAVAAAATTLPVPAAAVFEPLPVAITAPAAAASNATLSLPKPLFSSPLHSSPHGAYASRIRAFSSRDRSPGRAGTYASAAADKAAFMSPPHRPLRAPGMQQHHRGGSSSSSFNGVTGAPHAASAGAFAAQPSPARAAPPSFSSSSSSLPRAAASGRPNERARAGIKNWPQPKLYRSASGLHTALIARPQQLPRVVRITYQFESLVPQLDPDSAARDREHLHHRGGGGGGPLPSSLISRSASSASFVAAAGAAARRAARSTFHALERARLSRRAEQLARQEVAIANHARRRMQPIEDELTDVLGAMSLGEAAVESKTGVLTRDAYRTGSLSQRDVFVRTDVARRMFESSAAPRGVVDFLLLEVEAEVVRELVLETVAHAKKTVPLSEMELKRSSELLLSPSNKRIVDKFNIEITGKEIVCLRNLNWLNDEVMNFYLELIVERSKRNRLPGAVVAPSKRDAIHCFSSFFFTKLLSGGSYVHKNVARWSRSAKIDVAKLDKLIAPVHVGQNHWCCAIANIRFRRLEYYDSLGGRNEVAMESLRRYVADEVAAHHPELVKEMNVLSWPIIQPRRGEVPQQNNGSDCGVFSLQFANYASENRPFDFTYRSVGLQATCEKTQLW